MSAGRLIVCPTPIGNLEDVTLRVLAALREADIVACEDTRRSRVLLDRYGVGGSSSATTSTTSASAPPSWSRRCARARWSRWSPTPACRSSPTRVRARAGVRRRRARGRGAARAVGGAGGAGGERAPGRSVAVRRLPAAQAGRAREVFGARPRHGRVRVAQRVAASLQVLAELDPERPVAVCRELTKVHEEIVRGTAAELAARYASEPPRGEVVLVVGGAPSAEDESGRLWTRSGAWSTPARSRVPPRRWCRS